MLVSIFVFTFIGTAFVQRMGGVSGPYPQAELILSITIRHSNNIIAGSFRNRVCFHRKLCRLIDRNHAYSGYVTISILQKRRISIRGQPYPDRDLPSACCWPP